MAAPPSSRPQALVSLLLLLPILGCNSASETTPDESNEAPVISVIGPQRTWIDEPIDVHFTITDETPGSATITAASSDETLVADNDIELLGTGAERWVRLTPAPGGEGPTEIEITARDPDGLEDRESFSLEVDQEFGKQFPVLSPSDAAPVHQFGFSVSIDATLAVVGAPGDNSEIGSAYVFHNGGDEWTQSSELPSSPPVVDTSDASELRPSGATMGDQFGWSVDISGNYAIVGAPSDDESATDSGAAYIFERCTAVQACPRRWTEVAALKPDFPGATDAFGYSVAISGDLAIVGAPFDDDGEDNEFFDAGSAYVFQRVGDEWLQTEKLVGQSIEPYGDQFGYSVAISGDYAIVGAPYVDFDFSGYGEAYVFQRNGPAWTMVENLTGPNSSADMRFGFSVAISDDFALIGAPYGSPNGAAHVFIRSGETWTETESLSGPDTAARGSFGRAVAISGEYAVVGHPEDGGSGSVFVFERRGAVWPLTNNIFAGAPAAGELFGSSVSIGGEFIITGADWATSTGAAYVQQR